VYVIAYVGQALCSSHVVNRMSTAGIHLLDGETVRSHFPWPHGDAPHRPHGQQKSSAASTPTSVTQRSPLTMINSRFETINLYCTQPLSLKSSFTKEPLTLTEAPTPHRFACLSCHVTAYRGYVLSMPLTSMTLLIKKHKHLCFKSSSNCTWLTHCCLHDKPLSDPRRHYDHSRSCNKVSHKILLVSDARFDKAIKVEPHAQVPDHRVVLCAGMQVASIQRMETLLEGRLCFPNLHEMEREL
jgi:hypothetical protein